MNVNWRKWVVVGVVLLATHLATAWYYASRYARQAIQTPSRALTLDLSFDDWAAATDGADSASYVRVAERFARGKGITWEFPHANPPQTGPFYYWGPGAPVVLGAWLKLFGGRTMLTFFIFSVGSQLFFGVMAISTIRLYTRNTWALAATAFFTGFCPPLQQWFYGKNLTSSEIVSLIPLSIMFFAMAKAFLSYRVADSAHWRSGRFWRTVGWFGLASVLIGLHSLIRDSGSVFAVFVGSFLVGRAALSDRRRLLLAAVAASVLFGGVTAVRYPVRQWNLARMGQGVVCTSSEGCIWRYGLWLKHDACLWFEVTGIGLGEYLDHEAAARVDAYYEHKEPNPDLYSLGQLIQAVKQRPYDAVMFRVSRLPVLWLGADGDLWPGSPWPQWSITSWCCAFYLALLAFIAVQRWRQRYVPEPLYLYALLLICASALIHYEFRYAFPVWNTLVLVPGLLAATLSRNGWREPTESLNQEPTATGL